MVAALQLGAVGQRHLVGAGQRRALGEDLDLVAVEDVGVDALEPLDLGQHIVAQGRPVELAAADLPAEAARVLQILGEMGAVDEQLLGHAAADHAGAADPIFLGDRDPGAMRGGDPRRAHAARAGADHEQVIVDRLLVIRGLQPDRMSGEIGGDQEMAQDRGADD